MLVKLYHYLLNNQVIFALVIIGLSWIVFQLREILVSIFIAYILMAAIMPLVSFLQRHKFPKILAVSIPYFSILTAIFMLVVPLVQLFLPQVQSFIAGLPVFLNQSANLFGLSIDPKDIQLYLSGELASLGRNAFTVTSKIFGSVLATISVFFISFYFLMYHEAFKRWVASLFHKNTREKVVETMQLIDEKLGAWFRGEVTLMFSIGFMTWIALSIINMPYALPLAVIAGFLEIVPTLGPTLSAIPAVIVALTISPTLALTVVVIYIIIQQLENSLLVPKVMQRAVGLNPVMVIIAIMIGGNLMGVIGALLAIPFFTFLLLLFNGINEVEK
ncbi:MAG: AI-2E family transporter [Candidatus Levybacteria bacterium]|nr:AI-2E family transporter [Candidatus Levybacteria bacterium]